MSKIIKYLLAFIFGIFIGNLITPSNPVSKPEDVDQDSIIRDSIYIINDSIVTKIIYLEKEYEKEVSNVMSNDDSTNMVLFSRYIENYK